MMSTAAPCFGGDIWSNSAFALESPLKDLLDGGEFTLEQLLREDELLQEVKSMHPQLIDFISQSSSIARLIEYLVIIDTSSTHTLAAGDDDDDEDGIEYADSSVTIDEQEGVCQSSLNEATKEINTTGGSSELFIKQEKRAKTDGFFNINSVRERAIVDMGTEDNDVPNATERANLIAESSLTRVQFEENHFKQARLDGSDSEETILDKTNIDDNGPFFIEEDASNDEEEDRSLRHIRFPYMACEIVCCENSRIIDMLVNGKNENGVTLLDRFFSILDLPAGQVDDRHAGYFEKIITVLLRIRAKPVLDYINQRGLELFAKFTNHLHNYSIMSVLERLMLPSPLISDSETSVGASSSSDSPDNRVPEVDESLVDANNCSVLLACCWSENVKAISLLVDKLIEDNSPDSVVATHAAELLVSRVHQAPLASPILQRLSSGTVLQKIVRKASVLGEGEEFTSHDTGMTSALLLLESIVLQLGGFGCVAPVDESMSISFLSQSSNPTKNYCSTNHNENSETGEIQNNAALVNEINSIKLANANDLITLLPDSLSRWDALLTHKATKDWVMMNQMEQLIPMVGASRLHIVRLIEALVLLAHPVIDEQLVKANSIKHCLDLFFEFEWCSMLHQSVANLVVHVLEREGWRVPLQLYLINDLKLLERLLSAYEKKTMLYTQTSDTTVIFRLGFMGHVIIICQAIVHACSPRNILNTVSAVTTVTLKMDQLAASGKVTNDGLAETTISNSDHLHANDFSGLGDSELTALAHVVSQSPCCQCWYEFVSSTLVAITALQATPLGGSSPPSRGDEVLHNDDDDVLQMNENELDMAVTMIEAMNLPCEDQEYEESDIRDFESLCREHRKQRNGDPSLLALSDFDFSKKRRDYCFDDPLGRADRIDDGEIDTKDVALDEDDDSDVPILDLFAGNFGMISDVFPDSEEMARSPENDTFAENGDSSFFAHFDHFQTSNNSREPESSDVDAVNGDFATFDSVFDQKCDANSTVSNGAGFINELADANGFSREIADPFGTAKFNIDDIF